jgi:hypothetical protein
MLEFLSIGLYQNEEGYLMHFLGVPDERFFPNWKKADDTILAELFLQAWNQREPPPEIKYRII